MVAIVYCYGLILLFMCSFGLYILILTNLFYIKVLGNKYQTKLLEIIDGRLGSQILLTSFLF
jgi:hypothetical protein